MSRMKSAVKVTDEVLEYLDDMKSRMPEEYTREHTGEITGCNVIDFLLCYYYGHTDLEILRKEQRILEKNYVTTKQYYRSIDEHIESYDEDRKTINFLQQELKKSFAVEEFLKNRMKEQSDINTGIRQTLQKITADHDLQVTGFENNIDFLVQQQEQLNQSLLKVKNEYNNFIRDKYNDLAEKYNHNSRYIVNECIAKSTLTTLFFVSQLLFKYKKYRPFSFEQINKALSDISEGDVRTALDLSCYPVVPIVQINTKAGVRFQYDRRYLHIPLAQLLRVH